MEGNQGNPIYEVSLKVGLNSPQKTKQWYFKKVFSAYKENIQNLATSLHEARNESFELGALGAEFLNFLLRKHPDHAMLMKNSIEEYQMTLENALIQSKEMPEDQFAVMIRLIVPLMVGKEERVKVLLRNQIKSLKSYQNVFTWVEVQKQLIQLYSKQRTQFTITLSVFERTRQMVTFMLSKDQKNKHVQIEALKLFNDVLELVQIQMKFNDSGEDVQAVQNKSLLLFEKCMEKENSNLMSAMFGILEKLIILFNISDFKKIEKFINRNIKYLWNLSFLSLAKTFVESLQKKKNGETFQFVQKLVEKIFMSFKDRPNLPLYEKFLIKSKMSQIIIVGSTISGQNISKNFKLAMGHCNEEEKMILASFSPLSFEIMDEKQDNNEKMKFQKIPYWSEISNIVKEYSEMRISSFDCDSNPELLEVLSNHFVCFIVLAQVRFKTLCYNDKIEDLIKFLFQILVEGVLPKEVSKTLKNILSCCNKNSYKIQNLDLKFILARMKMKHIKQLKDVIITLVKDLNYKEENDEFKLLEIVSQFALRSLTKKPEKIKKYEQILDELFDLFLETDTVIELESSQSISQSLKNMIEIYLVGGNIQLINKVISFMPKVLEIPQIKNLFGEYQRKIKDKMDEDTHKVMYFELRRIFNSNLAILLERKIQIANLEFAWQDLKRILEEDIEISKCHYYLNLMRVCIEKHMGEYSSSQFSKENCQILYNEIRFCIQFLALIQKQNKITREPIVLGSLIVDVLFYLFEDVSILQEIIQKDNHEINSIDYLRNKLIETKVYEISHKQVSEESEQQMQSVKIIQFCVIEGLLLNISHKRKSLASEFAREVFDRTNFELTSLKVSKELKELEGIRELSIAKNGEWLFRIKNSEVDHEFH